MQVFIVASRIEGGLFSKVHGAYSTLPLAKENTPKPQPDQWIETLELTIDEPLDGVSTMTKRLIHVDDLGNAYR